MTITKAAATSPALALVLAGCVLAGCVLAGSRLAAWGAHGHTISGKAAALALPDEMPAFFRRAADQLAYLNPEPDRWRDRVEAERDPAMRDAFDPDHFINFERFPATALSADNRFVFLAELRKAGMEQPEAGLSPFRILEMFQRLRTTFRLWREAPDAETRGWIEQRAINDAGLLGHYVTDGANPLHTTIHHHGWIGRNPRNYAVDREIHSRFEGRYVQARLTLQDVTALVSRTPRVFTDARFEIMQYLRESHAQVVAFYEIDKRARFDEHTTAAENEQFTAERLAFGARMLRDLWWTAWMTSAPTPE